MTTPRFRERVATPKLVPAQVADAYNIFTGFLNRQIIENPAYSDVNDVYVDIADSQVQNSEVLLDLVYISHRTEIGANVTTSYCTYWRVDVLSGLVNGRGKPTITLADDSNWLPFDDKLIQSTVAACQVQ